KVENEENDNISFESEQLVFSHKNVDESDYDNSKLYKLDNLLDFDTIIKCVAINDLDVWILILGFSVYCEFKINNENEQNDKTKIQKILGFITSLNYASWTIDTKDNKDERYEIFDLYEDNISTLYSVFIAPRTQVIIDGIKRGFSLSKTFKTNRTLSKDMYQNKLNYSTLKFEDDFDAYILIVSTEFVQDRAFMGVFVFFKGCEIKPFYIAAILLQNNEFLVEYKNNNCDLDLVYTKTQDEFFLVKAQLYNNF
ncbi:6931_t:CDS:2, partial [Cetraspora pellucida]